MKTHNNDSKHLQSIEVEQTEKLGENIMINTYSKIGYEFFNSVINQLSKVSKSNYTFIGRLIEDENIIQTISLAIDGEITDNVSFSYLDTPIENIIKNGKVSIDSGVSFFSQKSAPQKENTATYIGTPLHNSDGDVIGVMIAMYRRLPENTETIKYLLEMLYARASAELDRQQTINVLQDNEHRLKLSLIATGQAMWDFNIETGHVVGSPELFTMLGFSPEEFVFNYDNWLKMMHNKDIKETLSKLNNYIEGKSDIYESEFRLKTKRGGYKWIFSKGMVVEWSKVGKPIRMLGTHVDIDYRKQAELDLVKSQKILSSIIENSPSIIYMKGLKGEYIIANKKFIELYKPIDINIKGKTDKELFPNDSCDLFTKHEKAVLESEKASFSEDKLVANNSSQTYLTVRFPVFNKKNELFAIGCISTNIGDKKRIEEELYNTKNLLTAAIEQSPAGILIADAPDVKIRIANPAALGIRKGNDNELINISVENHSLKWQTFYLNGEIYNPEDLPLSRAILKGEIVQNEEVIIKRSDQDSRIVLTNAAPVFDRNNEISAGIVVFSDITEIKKTEQELKKHKEKLELLVEERTAEIKTLLNGLKHSNRELKEINTELNEKQYEIQQQAEELRSTNETLEKQKIQIEQALEKLKKTQSQLVASEKMASLGILTAGIAHEINNPVNYISSALEGLKDVFADFTQLIDKYQQINHSNYVECLAEIEDYKKEIDYGDIREGIDVLIKNIQTGVDRTSEIIKGLRIFSRLDEDDPKLTDIHKNIDTTLVMLRSRYKDRIRIIKDYGKLPFIYCYPGKLNQVFMNIIANAIEAIGETGTINIITRPILHSKSLKPEKIMIRIEDNGKGMPQHLKDKIFEPFFTTKPVGKGTGLGLSISYSIIEQHQGQLTVHSELGEGSKFAILLPVDSKFKVLNK